MKERIGQIAQGIVICEKPLIRFSCEKLEESIPEGCVHNYEFFIISENQVPLKGTLYSSHPKVAISQSQIDDVTIQILVEVNALCTEKQIEGEFCLVSNGGEYRLPYIFHVKSFANQIEGASLKDLEDFSALAQKDFERAVKIFAGESFLQLDFMEENSRRALYLNLRGGNSERRALEEFLIGLKEKEPVYVTIEGEKESFYELTNIEDQKLTGEILLSFNGWGYTFVNCSSDMPWLQIKKRHIDIEEFQNGKAVCPYFIETKKLHAGKNYGRILFTTPYGSFSYQVYVKAPMKVRRKRGLDKKGWANLFALIMVYENEQLADEQALTALEEQAVALMKHYPDDARLHLLRAWVYINQKKPDMADKVLEWVQESIEEDCMERPEPYCFLLYLRALLTGEEADAERAKERIHYFYTTRSTSFLAVLELYVSPDYVQPDKAYEFLEKQFAKGHRSPLLYSITCRILDRDPALLTKLKPFELLALLYGSKNDRISQELVERILQLAMVDLKHFSISYEMLTRLYEKYGGKPLLAAICSLLVRAGKTCEIYHSWYALAVEKNISLTGLYDYYMYSMPRGNKTPIPPRILVAYGEKDDLDERGKRLLYTYIIKNHKKDQQLYAAYEKRMRLFAQEQLSQGNVSGDMRMIYHEFFYVDVVDDRLAKMLPDLLHSKKISTSLPFARRVVVRYAQLKKEVSRPIERGVAWIPIYMDSASVTFEDEYGNRYIDPEYEFRQVFIDEALFSRSCQLCPMHLMMLLGEAESFEKQPIGTDEELHLAVELLHISDLESSYRAQLMKAIIWYCHTHHGPATVECDPWLLELDYARLREEERSKVTEILIENGYYQEAYERIKQSGYQNIEQEKLLRLAGKQVVESMYGYDRWLLLLCHWTMQNGYYNETTLSYLAKFFQGGIRETYALLKTVREKNVKSRDLPERLLELMFFTGQYAHMTDVYSWYIQKDNILDLVQKAYYVLKCHCYFCREAWDEGKLGRFETIDAKMMEEWIRTESHTQKLPEIYEYALLEYYNACESLEEEQKHLAQELIAGLCKKGVWLECMVSMARHIPLPHELEGKAIIEVRSSEKRMKISAVRLPDQTEETSEMKQIWPGVFCKAFVLFADEVMFCYTSPYDSGREQEEEIRLSGTVCYMGEQSRYARINQAVLMLEEKNYIELQETLRAIEMADKQLQELLPLL